MSEDTLEPPRVNVLGVGISAINMTQALKIIESLILKSEQHYVCVTSVNGVMECQKDKGLKGIFNSSGLTTPDGMPLVWISKLVGFKDVSRVYGPDLMLALSGIMASKGYTSFFYGGGHGVAEELAEGLQERFPGFGVVGAYSPPFRPLTPEEDTQVINKINEADPDVLWIGLSTPKQERWMAEHRGRIKTPVMIGVGAAFDFLSGRKRQAPGWMQRSGLEWLFRLTQEPKRLWRRYLIYNPLFIFNLLLQWAKLKNFDLFDEK